MISSLPPTQTVVSYAISQSVIQKSFFTTIDLLTSCNIMFGLFRKDMPLLNHIILLGKQVIYQSRHLNIKPSLSLLKTKFKNAQQLELLIASKQNKCIVFIMQNGKQCSLSFFASSSIVKTVFMCKVLYFQCYVSNPYYKYCNMCNMCIVSTVSSLRVVGNVSVRGVNKVELRKKKIECYPINQAISFLGIQWSRVHVEL